MSGSSHHLELSSLNEVAAREVKPPRSRKTLRSPTPLPCDWPLRQAEFITNQLFTQHRLLRGRRREWRREWRCRKCSAVLRQPPQFPFWQACIRNEAEIVAKLLVLKEFMRTPRKLKDLADFPPKSMIPKDRGGGGRSSKDSNWHLFEKRKDQPEQHPAQARPVPRFANDERPSTNDCPPQIR
jgi:hypothetical protein